MIQAQGVDPRELQDVKDMMEEKALHPAICYKCEDWGRCNAKVKIGEVIEC